MSLWIIKINIDAFCFRFEDHVRYMQFPNIQLFQGSITCSFICKVFDLLPQFIHGGPLWWRMTFPSLSKPSVWVYFHFRLSWFVLLSTTNNIVYLLVGSFIQKNLYVSEGEEERRENRDQLYSVDLKQRIEHTVFLVNFLKGREELISQQPRL